MLRGFALHVLDHGQFHFLAGQGAGGAAVVELVPAGQPPGVVVRLAADHHAVQVVELLQHHLIGLDTAVDGNGELRKLGLEAVHHLVAQGRDVAVFLRAQALQPRVARMHDEHGAARLGHGADEVAHKAVVLHLVDADAVLDGDGHAHHVLHGLHAVGHQLRRLHQAGTKRAALYAIAGAAAVQVDFVVTPFLTQPGGLGQFVGLVAAQLQGHGVLFGVVAQVALGAAIQNAACVHHLGVQQGLAGQQPVKVTAVAVSPVHHGGDGHAPGAQGGFHGQTAKAGREGSAAERPLWSGALRGCRCEPRIIPLAAL